jgi:hypothetical protein
MWNGIINMITNWTEENDITLEPLAWWEIKRWVFKIYNEFLYNQNLVDKYSCSIVWTATAIANFLNKDIGIIFQKKAFELLKKRKKFTPWLWAYIKDWIEAMVDTVNDYILAWTTWIKIRPMALTVPNIIYALEQWSPIVTGIKYGKWFFLDEQDDWEVNKSSSIWNSGHCVAIVKINTEDDHLIKYCENYKWVIEKNVILNNFWTMSNLWFQTWYYFTK